MGRSRWSERGGAEAPVSPRGSLCRRHMPLYFIGGVHGVGKTSLCQRLAPALAARHITASDLIRHGAAMEDQGEKAVSNLDGNQLHLLRALGDLRRTDETILLDGHFCLFSPEPHVARIPVGVFASIDPAAILLVEAPPSLIKRRLEQRDGRSYDLQLLEDFSGQEREHAQLVSASLSVPFRSISYDEPLQEAASFLESVGRHPR